ncbi:MAG: uroporphyrinogen-III synthase [Acidobacteriota bacterium]
MSTRVLVLRSGGIPFPRPEANAGFDLVEKATHEIRPRPTDFAALAEPASLAVFTSQIAVRILLGDPEGSVRFRDCLTGGRVGAVGDATAEALRRLGVEPAFVAAGYGSSVLDMLPADLDGRRVILPRGADATDELADGLRRRRARVVLLVLYDKEPVPRDPGLDAEIAGGSFSGFCATSPAAARWLFETSTEKALGRLRETPAVVLGRFTGRYLESHGIARVSESAEPSFSSAFDALRGLALAATAPPA